MGKIPILLLKTKSTPEDSYEDLLSSSGLRDSSALSPQFIPVLQHRFEDNGISLVRKLLKEQNIGQGETATYGGLIFTSQRAVEAFAHVVEQERPPTEESSWPHLQQVPVYSVGPATTRALSAVNQSPPLQIFGQHTGNGNDLAHYMLDHYGQWYSDRREKPPLLFLVGEQRRDIIPRTLTDPTLPLKCRIPVTEEVVYGTGVMESFPVDFSKALEDSEVAPLRWVVVFSPTGCDSMLRVLGMLDESTGRVIPGKRDKKTFIATIGPTTRDFLVDKFGFQPDVCADTPSPEGVLQGIRDFQPT